MTTTTPHPLLLLLLLLLLLPPPPPLLLQPLVLLLPLRGGGRGVLWRQHTHAELVLRRGGRHDARAARCPEAGEEGAEGARVHVHEGGARVDDCTVGRRAEVDRAVAEAGEGDPVVRAALDAHPDWRR
jgi:hypothetical protein